MNIKRFLKRMFCWHEYEVVDYWKHGTHYSVIYRCSKCGKEKFRYSEY